MSKNYKYSQAEENYIRDKLDELAKNGRLLASTDDVFDYLEEIGVAFSGYFDSLPRTEQRRIVEEHKQKHREYEAGPAVAASGARGALSADSAYGSSSRMSGPTGIDRLRQADEDSDCASDTFAIFVVISNKEGERVIQLRARFDHNDPENFMCLATARDLYGMTMNLGMDIPIRWRHMKDDPHDHQTWCRLRNLTEKENQDVNVILGSVVSRPGSNIDTEPPTAEDPELEAFRARARAKNAALLVDEMTELDVKKRFQKRPGR